MKKLLVTLICFVVILMATAYASLDPSNSDLWQYTNFVTTPQTSGVHIVSDVRHIFGGNLSSVEPTGTLFKDFMPAGTVHNVSWQTTTDQTIRSIGFFANHDGSAAARGVSRFTLYAEDLDNGNTEVKLYEVFPSDPYGDTPGNNAGDSWLSLESDIATPVRANKYRAEFVQFGEFAQGTASGPRIHELDAYSTFLDGNGGNDEECGNGILESPEECDDGSDNGVHCIPGYNQACNFCTSECQLVPVEAPVCGDSIIAGIPGDMR